MKTPETKHEPELYATLRRVRAAGRALARSTDAQRIQALDAIAVRLSHDRHGILAANARDLERATGLSAAMRDRLKLTPSRLDAVIAAVGSVRDLPDPLGAERPVGERPNGLKVFRRRIPLGVLAVIYEARPNVTVESATLAIRSGNAVVLRGGSEAIESNTALADAVRGGLEDAGFSADAVVLVRDLARERMAELLGATGLIDLAIPRGGPALMEFVDAHARVPVIRHGAGVCQVYVDRDADLDMAVDVAFNAKVQRPGVCNAMETLLVHEAVVDALLSKLGERYATANVELRADARCLAALRRAGVTAREATEADWDTEFLDLILALRAVPGLDAALDHIARHGTGHTAAIVTRDAQSAERFLAEVDASCVLWNASTRFNDGGELGLGAEIGISTSRMHAFGPMSARELTAEKFVVRGDGQVRG